MIFPNFDIEQELARDNLIIAGIDEAGRGCLAGPLSVGMVIYDPMLFGQILPEGMCIINDSKKLTHEKRLYAYDIIKNCSRYHSCCFVSSKYIDKENINIATQYAIEQLLISSPLKPDILIIDGNYKFDLHLPYISIIKGDSKSLTIASASIVAKVKRDALMDEYENIYHGYGFNSNKGYGTKKHIMMIEKSISPIHRKSYEPVKSLYKISAENV